MGVSSGWSVVVLVLASCGEKLPKQPGRYVPDAPPPIDAPPDAAPITCAAPTGVGTIHQTFTTAQTWTAATSPHVVLFDATISAPITIEPCAVVRIAGSKVLTIVANGAIIANGAVGQPVTFERRDPGTAYGPIRAFGGVLSLTHTIMREGGNPLGVVAGGATIIMARSVSATTGSLHLDDVEIANSASQGIHLQGVLGFDAGSKDVRIHGSVGYPIVTYANLLGSIPSGVYTGNATDELLIAGSGGQVTTSQTMHDRGIPYRVGEGPNGQLDVVGPVGTVAVLTIEPGVRLKFHPGGRMRIEPGAGPAKGALIAVGTPAKRIVFTSVSPTPVAGAWIGVWFAGTVAPASRMQYVRVEFAGGTSNSGSNSCPYPGRNGINHAAIRIFGPASPLSQFITDTEILSSALDGIDRGWRDNLQPSFLPTNTITNLAAGGCKESLPRTFAGVCPSVLPCPQ